jgi:hypothetical protein
MPTTLIAEYCMVYDDDDNDDNDNDNDNDNDDDNDNDNDNDIPGYGIDVVVERSLTKCALINLHKRATIGREVLAMVEAVVRGVVVAEVGMDEAVIATQALRSAAVSTSIVIASGVRAACTTPRSCNNPTALTMAMAKRMKTIMSVMWRTGCWC